MILETLGSERDRDGIVHLGRQDIVVAVTDKEIVERPYHWRRQRRDVLRRTVPR